MCGFVGFANFEKNISQELKKELQQSSSVITDGYYIRKHIALAHKRLIVVDPDGR